MTGETLFAFTGCQFRRVCVGVIRGLDQVSHEMSGRGKGIYREVEVTRRNKALIWVLQKTEKSLVSRQAVTMERGSCWGFRNVGAGSV